MTSLPRINRFKMLPKARVRKLNIRNALKEIKGQRLLEGFYFTYLHPEKVGDRSLGWRMMAHD